MLKTAIISVLSMAMPIVCQVTEPSAVQFSTTHANYCYSDQSNYYISDNVCSSLPGSWLRVNGITDTCRGMYIYPWNKSPVSHLSMQYLSTKIEIVRAESSRFSREIFVTIVAATTPLRRFAIDTKLRSKTRHAVFKQFY